MSADPAVDMWRGGVTDRVLRGFKAERRRQIVKWGHQTREGGTSPQGFAMLRDMFRNACDNAEAEGGATWRHILLEEVYEAFAESDPQALRTELIQCGAVITAWIEDIDLTGEIV